MQLTRYRSGTIRMSLLGIDVGTSGCKAAAFAESGKCLASAYREYATLHPRPGWAELNSREVWNCIKSTIAEVSGLVARDPVRALCVSSMGEAMTPVSENRQILGSCVLSSDTRGVEYVEALSRRISQEAFFQINPNIIGPQYSLPKLLWLREHQPAFYAHTHKFLLWGDLVGFMLGCDPVTSYSQANRTLLFDIRKEGWSDPLLLLTGIERAKLPAPQPSGSVAGTVCESAARELNLPKDVDVVVGGHDQCCSSLGAGVYQAGKAVCGIGTFECITPTYDHLPDGAAMLRHGLNIEHHVLPDLFVSFIYNQGGTLVRWFRDTFACADRKLLPAGEDIYEALAREMPPEPTHLFTLPYFEMTGPPSFIADASGVVVGLKTSTTRGEILKSIMESVTFYFAENLHVLNELGVSPSEFVATGGGAKSDQWLQIKADIFGVPFARPHVTEASVLGAAILAAIAVGVFRHPGEAVGQFVKVEKLFEPDPIRHRIYQQRLEAYRELFPLLKDFLARLETSGRD
ncbi:MAG: FGGY-family carbohydrate kinase [Terriglobia bacterium]